MSLALSVRGSEERRILLAFMQSGCFGKGLLKVLVSIQSVSYLYPVVRMLIVNGCSFFCCSSLEIQQCSIVVSHCCARHTDRT